ncbi:aldose 1-epimerase [Candidatus Symbiothrix dinenymphae]|nr:aldose 1-epimerase [Candidatus Symbiothrix dinenymphae]
MEVISRIIGDDHGKDVGLFNMQNMRHGTVVELFNYGATIVALAMPNGKMLVSKSKMLEMAVASMPPPIYSLDNIGLSYPVLEEFRTNPFYLGSTIGRFANRISNAQFTLDGTTYQLEKNDGANTNHGGFSGFHNKVFDYEIMGDSCVKFTYESADGEGGFPGKLRLSVTYTLTETNILNIEYKALSDKKTVFNPTNHTYFNLSGNEETVLNHQLEVFADEYLETDDAFLPTGKILPVADIPFDFRKFEHGYNTYFISNSKEHLKHLATLSEPTTGRRLEVHSTMPGIQVYTGDHLSQPFFPCAGIALEAQGYPDAPNHAHFPSCVIEAGKEATFCIQYRFFNPATA